MSHHLKEGLVPGLALDLALEASELVSASVSAWMLQHLGRTLPTFPCMKGFSVLASRICVCSSLGG